jgi:hypothetical protein
MNLVSDWRNLLRRNTSVAQQVLVKLLGDARVTSYPTADGYEVGAAPSVAKLLMSVPALKKALVPVRVYARGWNVKFAGIGA